MKALKRILEMSKIILVALIIVAIGCHTEKKDFSIHVVNNINSNAIILKELEIFIDSNKACEECKYQIVVDKQSDSITLIKFVAYQGVAGEFINNNLGLIYVEVNGVKVELICGIENLFALPQAPTTFRSDEAYLSTKCYILNGNTLIEQSDDCQLFLGIDQRNSEKFIGD